MIDDRTARVLAGHIGHLADHAERLSRLIRDRRMGQDEREEMSAMLLAQSESLRGIAEAMADRQLH